MAEEAPETPQDGEQAQTEPATPSPKAPASDPDSERAGTDLAREDLEKALRKARDESAKMRARAKFAFDDEESFTRAQQALVELQNVEDAKRSEVEKLTERNEQLLYRSTESDKALLRLRAALGAGIPTARVDEFASRLRGDTLEELTADAAELAVLFAPTKPERRSDPSQGAGSDVRPVGNPLQAALESKLGIPRP